MTEKIIEKDFYTQDAVSLAKSLLGKLLVRKYNNGEKRYFIITETEAYLGVEDKACHCSKGKTERTKVMYEEGGTIYIYLIYGMYWMLNIVSGKKDKPEAVLIRGIAEISEYGKLIKHYDGPGKAGKVLEISKDLFNGQKIYNKTTGLFISVPQYKISFKMEQLPRVGINYAGEPWISKPWRFVAKEITLQQ